MVHIFKVKLTALDGSKASYRVAAKQPSDVVRSLLDNIESLDDESFLEISIKRVHP